MPEMVLQREQVIIVRGRPIQVAVDAAVTPSGKPPLLLCNGIGASLEVLEPFAVAAAVDRDVIRFDAPGAGRSPARKVPLRFPALAGIAKGVVNALGHEKADVLGISWGGALAQQIAFSHPRFCRRLILVSTATGALMVPARPQVLAKMVTPRRYRDPKYAAEVAGELYGGSARERAGHAAAALQAGPRSAGGRGYVGQLYAGSGWTSLPFLPMIRQRTLIIAGTDDPLIPVANARIMNRLLPHATLALHDGGHLALVSEADTMARDVKAFLDAE